MKTTKKYFAVYVNIGNVSPQKGREKLEMMKTQILENKDPNEKYYFIPVKVERVQ